MAQNKKQQPQASMGVINPQILEAMRRGEYRMDPAMLRPEPKIPAPTWACFCGTVNNIPVCPACGRPKPDELKTWQCDKCGWIPEDQKKPPKFCIECGDPFTEEDRR